ncbi:MAG: prolyl oligopeptidase family serine peptidase [Xanthomonadales bacterium]|jgi:acetyl esterase/lipase|nr:prolyl oligopeptidase family serine peptidase [Xanthomonadales bacterium]
MRSLMLCAATLWLTTTLPAAETPKVPSFAELAKRPAIRSLQLSPNGKLLGAMIPVDNARNVVGVIDLATLEVKAAAKLRASDETFSGFTWVSDRYLLLSYAQRRGGFAAADPTGELASMDVETGRVKYVFGYRGDMQIGSRIDKAGKDNAAAFVIADLPGKDAEVLIQVVPFGAAETSELRKLDVRTGRTRIVTRSPVRRGSFWVDHAGEVRVALGAARFGESKAFLRVDGEWKPWPEAHSGGRNFAPLSFASDNQHLYARVSHAEGPDSVVKIDLETGTETRIFRGSADPEWQMGTAIPTFDGQDLAAVITNDALPGLHWLNPDSAEAKLVRAMQPQLPGHFVWPVSASEDGQRVLLKAVSDRNDGDYFLYNRQSREASFVMASRDWLPIEALAPTEAIALTARDGLKLQGYLTRPHPAVENAPLVVMPHGGPHGIRDDWVFDPLVQSLATRGYAVLQLNFRGSGGYGKTFLESGYRQWGRKMQDDLTDATRWALETHGFDAGRVALYGASYGGYAALMGAAREPELYRCAISYVGVSDLPLMYTRGDIEDSTFGVSYLKQVIGTDEAELKANSPSQRAEQIRARVFLIHGGRDERVPIKHAELMRDALTAAGNPPEWYVEPTEGH